MSSSQPPDQNDLSNIPKNPRTAAEFKQAKAQIESYYARVENRPNTAKPGVSAGKNAFYPGNRTFVSSELITVVKMLFRRAGKKIARGAGSDPKMQEFEGHLGLLLRAKTLETAQNEAEECLSLLNQHAKTGHVNLHLKNSGTVVDPVYTLISRLIEENESEKADAVSTLYLSFLDEEV
jgi:hypothetical protein